MPRAARPAGKGSSATLLPGCWLLLAALPSHATRPACFPPQMASQAGSKLSRMAQSFMRDLQGGY